MTGSPWGAVPPAGSRTAAGVASRLGAYCWVEQQIFGWLGGWVPQVPELDVKLAVAEHADHAGWRAQRWYELLPMAAPGPDALVGAPDGLVELSDRVDAIAGGAGRTIEKLAVVYRVVLPRLAAAQDAHRSWSDPVSGAEVGRMLGLVSADLAADWVEGERLLQTLLGSGSDLDRCHRAQVEVERFVSGAGGIAGRLSAGERPLGGGS